MEDVIEKGVQVNPGSKLSDADREMVEHYVQTGTYRAEDVQRVLGDPRQGVGLGAVDSFTFKRLRDILTEIGKEVPDKGSKLDHP